MMLFRNMENRRRSERRKVALPVWIKDARGGERTQTADVSAHGISVLSAHSRPERQYVELELELPDSNDIISVTAMVARCGTIVEPTTGYERTGMGLDFFLFDAKSKARWQSFLRSFLIEELPAPTADDDVNAEDVPAFLIRPRDLDRLWGFFRGELARAQVRIESSVVKAPGTVVELIVVHPVSGEEWVLDGEVLTVSQRSTQTSLEIGLPGLDPALIEAFRAFIVSGRGQIQEDVPLSGVVELSAIAAESDDEGPERIESVVVHFDDLGSPGEDDLDDEDPTLQALNGPWVPPLFPDGPPSLSAPVDLLPSRRNPSTPPSSSVPILRRAPRPPGPATGPTAPGEVSPRVFAAFFAEAAAAASRTSASGGPLFDRAMDDETYSGAVDSPPVLPAPPPLPSPAPLPVTRPSALGPPRLMDHRADRGFDVRPRLATAEAAPNLDPYADNAEPSIVVATPNPTPFLPALVTVRTTKAVLDRQIVAARARLAQRPTDVTASLELSNLLLSRGDQKLLDEAIDIIRRVAAMMPGHGEAHHRLAELFARKGDYRLARGHLAQAKRLGHPVDADLERLIADGHRATTMRRLR